MAGRKHNVDTFTDLNFSFIKGQDRKYRAHCNVCQKALANTAHSRLIAHRNICKLKTSVVDQKNLFKCQQSTPVPTTSGETERSFGLDFPNEIVFGADGSEITTTVLCAHDGPQTEFNDTELQPRKEATPLYSDTYAAAAPTSSSSCNISATSKFPSSTSRKRKIMSSFVDSVSPEEIRQLNETVAKFFYGCNIPFSVIESDLFKELMTKLRPAYGPLVPTRKVLSTTLLDSVYSWCIDQSASTMSNESVLLIDGWKNSSKNAKTVVSMIHNAAGSQAFVNAWDLSGESETGEKLVEIVSESCSLAKTLYDTTVFAVVSDNAAAMKKMGRNSGLWHSTCNAHTANLLAKDVIDVNLNKEVSSILKEFKNTDFESLLVKHKGSRIQLPVDTRWCSHRDSYKCLVSNLHIMKTIIINEPMLKKIKVSVKTLIFDDDFIERVQENIGLLDPICELINRTQSSDCTVAEAVSLWLNLKLPHNFSKFENQLELRKEMALNVYALTAYYLHPYYREQVYLLSPAQLDVINDFLIETLDASGLEDLHNFNEKKGIFGPLIAKKLNNAEVFWSLAKHKHPNLSSLAVKLVKLPASSAQIERVFSNWSYVHSQIRNRLTFERSKKLVHVYYTLKVLDRNESDEY